MDTKAAQSLTVLDCLPQNLRSFTGTANVRLRSKADILQI